MQQTPAWRVDEVLSAAGERDCLAEDWLLSIDSDGASIWPHWAVGVRHMPANKIEFRNWAHGLTGVAGLVQPPMKVQLRALAVLTGATHWFIEGDILIIENNAGDRVIARSRPLIRYANSPKAERCQGG